MIYFIWVLLPVKIILLILSRDNRLVGRKREIPQSDQSLRCALYR